MVNIAENAALLLLAFVTKYKLELTAIVDDDFNGNLVCFAFLATQWPKERPMKLDTCCLM